MGPKSRSLVKFISKEAFPTTACPGSGKDHGVMGCSARVAFSKWDRMVEGGVTFNLICCVVQLLQ